MKDRLKKKLKAKKILGDNGRSFNEPKSTKKVSKMSAEHQQKLAEMTDKREKRQQTIVELDRIANDVKAKMTEFLNRNAASV